MQKEYSRRGRCQGLVSRAFLSGLVAVGYLALGHAQELEVPLDDVDAVDPDKYQIGPGDTLNVFVWRQPELSTNVPVRPDGRISTPLVEDLVAVGKTPTQLARDIEDVLGEYIRTPQVTIIVQRFVGTFGRQIRVLGQVSRPGPIAYRDEMTLLDVMLEAGGLTQFASGNRAKLVRNVDGEPVEQRLRLKRLLEKGDLRENLAVEPGDVIIVPEAVF